MLSYNLLGRVSFILIFALLLLFAVSGVLGILLIKKRKVLLPKLLLFTVDTFYLQIKRLARTFGLRETVVDQVAVELRNILQRERFKKVKARDRILVVPQCLRSLKCPARLDSRKGITCKGCGLCVIKEIKAEAERLGYRFFIVPGGTFVERIVGDVRPKATLGVACFKDLNLAMHGISRGKTPVQGVSLMRDGCVETEVDLEKLFELMKLGIEEVKPRLNVKGACSGDGRPLSS